MKKTPFAAALFVICMSLLAMATVAQDVKEEPLSYQDVKTTDGATLYVELCASCHGKAAKGDGPAAKALKVDVPDLTGLAAANGGTYPAKKVDRSISGERRTVAHGTLDMPIWGQALSDVRPDWGRARQDQFVRTRILNLVKYIETLQVK